MSIVVDEEHVAFARAQAGLRAAVEGQLTALAETILSHRLGPILTREALIQGIQALVTQYGTAAAVMAAEWYDDLRAMKGIPDTFTATPLTQDFSEQIDRTVRRAIAPLFTENYNIGAIANSIVVKASQYAIDGARNTVIENTRLDPRSAGWQRIPNGPTCDFCMMLVGRGGVYREKSVGFRAHAHCDCAVAPSWDLNAAEVPKIAYQASERMEALRRRADAGDRSASRQLKAYRGRVQSYMAEHQDEFARLREAYGATVPL